MRTLFLIILSLVVAFAPAGAEVKSSGPAGFELESVTTVPVSPAEAYAALGRVGEWWSSDHTYSGDAANMTLAPEAGGCFCEAIPADGGSVEHGRVVLAWPGRTLRLQAALGPLQQEAVQAVLTWSLVEEDGGTRITQNYVVGGPVRGGSEALAPLVDQVMTLQLERLRVRLSRE